MLLMLIMQKKNREQILITLQIPQTMKDIMEKIVYADTHSNMSEFIRDAIRQKIQRENPQLLQNLIKEE